MRSVTLQAFAKLNLTLDILGTRPDGYHDLAMVMQSISLCDTLRVTLAGKDISCRVDGADLPADEGNLVVKAAKAFFRETGIAQCGVEIEIEKRIPIAAGMAGGSADAAAVLKALRALLAPPDLSDTELERIGATVGSDVPFCLRGGTALAEGRGEILTTLKNAPKLHVVVCKPDFSISTPVLFKRSDSVTLTQRPDTGAMLRAIDEGDADGVIAALRNVFEEVLPDECGEVFTIRGKLLALGANGAQMTGSGPTVFGLFKDLTAAERAAQTLKTEYEQTYLCSFV